MALFSELIGRHGNDDINGWLQLRAWQQSVLLAHTNSDVVTAPVDVATATTRDVIAAGEKDNRFLSGKRLGDSYVYRVSSSLGPYGGS